MQSSKKPAPPEFSTRGGTIPYAARRIGVSVPIVYRLIAAGKLRSYKIGRAHRVGDAAIEDCIRLLEAETASQAKAA